MSAEQLEAEAKAMKEEIDNLNKELEELRKPEDEGAVLSSGAAGCVKTPKPVGSGVNAFTATAGKMSSIAWLDNEHLATILQDGKIVVHNAMHPKGGTMRWFRSQSTWLMTSKFSPDGTKIAVAGLDNLLTIHNFNLDENQFGEDGDKPFKVCEKHGGYIGSMQWVNDTTCITGSGDKSILRWDLTQTAGVLKEPVNSFVGHEGDVGCLANIPGSTDTFLSGSADGTVKMWDARVPHGNGCITTYHVGTSAEEDDQVDGDKYGVNCLKYMEGTDCFVTGSEDGTARIYDIRAQQQLAAFEPENSEPIHSIATSKSHRLLYLGGKSGEVKALDVLTGNLVWSHSALAGGEVSSLELAPDGHALAGCSRAVEVPNNFAVFI